MEFSFLLELVKCMKLLTVNCRLVQIYLCFCLHVEMLPKQTTAYDTTTFIQITAGVITG